MNRAERRQQIEEFILFNVRKHPEDIVQIAVDEFNLSRQAILRYVRDLIAREMINATGETRNRHYELVPITKKGFKFSLEEKLEEDVLWRKNILPDIERFPKNIVDICEYGFTEIVNNAIEHSEGTMLQVALVVYIDQIEIVVRDNGVGIFYKIQRECDLDDPLHAILELSKGKLTTDPKKHTGEGIFFTSRVFDTFEIWSHNQCFSHTEVFMESYDMLTEQQEREEGTTVFMWIGTRSDRTIQSVFNHFNSDPGSMNFDKTIVPVRLARYGKENLVSRSQARRLLARFELFREVVLDFDDIETIGQAFADEVFRVFVNAHPDTKIHAYRANENILKMIERVQNGS